MTVLRVTLALALVVGVPLFSAAAVINVPGDAPSIQAGIDAAAYGDTVMLASGTYEEHDILMRSGVWVMSETGDPSTVTISGTDQGRVFHLDQCGGPCGLEGLTITRGFHPTLGGGVYMIWSSATFKNCLFTENTSVHGSMESGSGAGLYVGCAALRLEDCRFADNYARHRAGAIYGSGSSVVCNRCVFDANTAGASAGAIYWTGVDLLLLDCVFRGNHGVAGMGALYLYGNTCEIEVCRCWFEGNTTGGFAGALFARAVASLLVEDSVFIGNQATYSASAIDLYNPAPYYLTGCTIVGNTGSPSTEALRAYEASAHVENTIIAFNGPGPSVDCEYGGSVLLSCSDVYGNSGGDWVGCIAAQLGTDSNFSADPMFCDMANGDLSLDGMSPCAPGNSPCGELVGARGVGCSSSPVSQMTWGRLKALYR
ncbi:MAG: hypothetical protein IMY84_01610 [Chloroflexi bacterium]|nr:hypothetical protein [Chloroflexota bacterium]